MKPTTSLKTTNYWNSHSKKQTKQGTLKVPKKETEDFPGGPVDKNPPANAENTDSIPGLGRSHMAEGQLSPCA